MIFADIFGALIISLLIAVIFSFIFKVRGPWESFFVFLAIIFLFTWLIKVWVPPYGPLVWGYPIFVGLFMALLVALLLAAVTPLRRIDRRNFMSIPEEVKKKAVESSIVFGFFFWFFIFFVLVAISIAYLI